MLKLRQLSSGPESSVSADFCRVSASALFGWVEKVCYGKRNEQTSGHKGFGMDG